MGDQRAGLHWWLIPPGVASDWRLPGVEVWGRGRELVVPPLGASAGALLWWAGVPGRPLTDPERLRVALSDIVERPRRSPDCATERHAACRHGAVARDVGYGVRAEACACGCHVGAGGVW
ncbi:hypothetical protein [Streptomyces radicis]|uniref:hypothetical protein n=1 Tax=Streptomyces radicis TaxID=1750517 RepID=UPI0016005461|nr:hypothetical protein [Streptomyces radicis]